MSRTEAGWLMLLLALVPGWLAGAGPEDRPAEELLAMLVPREEAVAEMHAQVARLGSEEFKVREAAMEVLRQAPVLPREVIERGLASGEPEIVSRLRAIMEGGMRSRSTEVFETALERIVAGKQRGLLEGIAAALDVGVIAGDVALAERAAGVTAEAGDGELLRRLAEDGEAMRRRMAAAGCEALGADGLEVLKKLLEDADEAVRMRAAISAGNLGERAGVPVLARFLGSPDPVARVRAWSALRGLTGKDFDYSPLDPEEKREAARREWSGWLGGEGLVLVGRAGEANWKHLFNGRDLSGWEAYRGGVAVDAAEVGWKVEDGVLVCPGQGPGDLRSAGRYGEYVLVVRFRAPEENSDSGIGVLLAPGGEQPVEGRRDGGSYLEVQLLPQRSGDLYAIGGIKVQAGGADLGFSHPREGGKGDLAGEWQEMRLEVGGGVVKVFLNGALVNEAEGGPKEPSRILLREEMFRFEFKEVALLLPER